MTAIGVYLDEGDGRSSSIQRMDNRARRRRRIKPIRIERDNAETRLRTFEGSCERAAVILGEIEIIARAGDVEIRIRIEPIDETRALIAQIILDLEIGVERKSRRSTILILAAELA